MSMTLTINGTDHEVDDHATIVDLLKVVDLGPDDRGVAVAVDSEVVPRHRWHTTAPTGGARIEIVRAAAGG